MLKKPMSASSVKTIIKNVCDFSIPVKNLEFWDPGREQVIKSNIQRRNLTSPYGKHYTFCALFFRRVQFLYTHYFKMTIDVMKGKEKREM